MSKTKKRDPAAVSLAAFTKAMGWSDELAILTATGYVASFRELDPERLTDAAAAFLRDSGMPSEFFIRFLCGLIDEADVNAPSGGDFAAYLDVVRSHAQALDEGAAEPAETDEPAAYDFVFPMTADEKASVARFLAAPGPIPDSAIGDVLYRGSDRHQTDPTTTCYLDVVNGDAGPVVDLYVMSGRRMACSVTPHRELADYYKVTHAGGVYHVAVTDAAAEPDAAGEGE